MRTRPHNLIYAVDERPPMLVLILQGLQHVSLTAVSLLVPLIVARAAGLPEEALPSIVSFSMIAIALATLLQAWRFKAFGAGYLMPGFCSSNYLSASMSAAQTGGMPLVYGMTVLAGLFEAVLSRAIVRLRPYLPPELSGVAMLIIGMDLGVVAFKYLTLPQQTAASSTWGLVLGLGTFALAFALSIYGKGSLRLFCSLIAVVAGYVLALAMGLLPERSASQIAAAAVLDLPSVSHIGFAFDPYLILPFMLVSLSALLKTIGAVTTCQKINDQAWVRPEMTEVQKGVAADGLASVAAGLMGSVGQTSSTSNIGVSSATGATSRWIALPIAAWLLVMACSPKFATVLVVMPDAVMGGSLMFSACFILVNGLQITTSRMLDTRRTAVVGLSLILAISTYAFPGFYRALPQSWQPLVGSALSMGVLAAFFLNLVLRIGVRQRQTVTLGAQEEPGATMAPFMDRCGASWGARTQVIHNATLTLAELLEALQPLARPGEAFSVTAAFDEFNVDLEVRYKGRPLNLAGPLPTPEEMLEDPDRVLEMRGVLVARLADRIRITSSGDDEQVVTLHFQH